MSYAKFLDDMEALFRARSKAGISEKLSMESALALVRDHWLKEGNLDPLIKFTLTNWDSGNCDEFIEPIEERLIAQADLERFVCLWVGILKHRLSNLRDYLSVYRQQFGEADPEALLRVEVSDFAVHRKESYSDIRRVVAYHLRFTLDGIERYRSGLTRLGAQEHIGEATALWDAVADLRPPKRFGVRK